MRRSKIYNLNDNDFKKLVKNSFSYSDVLRKLNLTTRGGSSTDILKNRIRTLECDTSHFCQNKSARKALLRKPLYEVLIENSTYTNIHYLKTRIISEMLLDYKCSICGNNGVWMGKTLSLHLDHINGKNNDHRIENLRFLCPNCHSQTPTYSGKNKNRDEAKVAD